MAVVQGSYRKNDGAPLGSGSRGLGLHREDGPVSIDSGSLCIPSRQVLTFFETPK